MNTVTQKSVWTKVWGRQFTDEENRRDILLEQKSVRWKKMRTKILRRFGSFKGLKVIEIGAGRGVYSLLAALEGASVTLLDREPLAFKRAEEFFKTWNLTFEAVAADAFSIPTELSGQFDLSMSFGFAEHFRNPERFEIFESHVRLVKPGGLIAVSVPNAWFFPYRIGKWLLERGNKWSFGLEIPFTRFELEAIGKRLGLKHPEVFGSGFTADFLNFWILQRAFHLPGYLWDRYFASKTARPLKERVSLFSGNPESPWDDFLGYALVLLGEKNGR